MRKHLPMVIYYKKANLTNVLILLEEFGVVQWYQ